MNGSNKDFDALLVSVSRELIDKDAETLNSVDTSTVKYPPYLDKKIIRKIKNQERMKKYGGSIRVFKNIAAAFLIVCTAALALCLSVNGVRAEIWNIVVDLTGGRTKVTVDTNVDVPNTIITFKEPTIEPEGLIKKVMWKADDYHLIGYFDDEDALPFDYRMAFAQRPVATNDGLIAESSGQKKYENIVINNTNGMLVYGDKGFSIYWHDEEYVYSIFCRTKKSEVSDNSSISQGSGELELLIRMAESVK